MNVTRSGTETMTSFQATLVNAGYGQLALRDKNGKIAQKWTLGHPKCVIGAHANCNVRCMLPGIADHHLLLVVGARQIYLRALAAGVERDGVAINELVMSGDQTQFAIQLAGHCFEYSRQSNTVPVAKPFVDERSSQSTAGHMPAPTESPKRLRFTFVQALEKNRDRNEIPRMVDSDAQATAQASERPVWVEEIVREALRPVELRLESIAQPINNLERQLRRQRARLRKQQHARKLSQHAPHEVAASHAQNSPQAYETIEKIVADQSARLELVNERVGDIVSQLASLERIVSAENDQHREVISRTSQSGEEIVRLQHEMLALVSALQTRIAQPAVSSSEELQWRASIQRQLVELHESLGILDEIKSSLDVAVSQNRELSQDLETRWQAIEEIANRPVVIPPAPIMPTETPLPLSPLARANEQAIDRGGSGPTALPEERALLAATTADAPAAPGDFRIEPVTTSIEPVPLPSWWTEDPVAENELHRLAAPSPSTGASATEAAYYNADSTTPANLGGSLTSDPTSSPDAGYPKNAAWLPTEYEQETGLRQIERFPSYGSPAVDELKNAYPTLDVPHLLTSAIVETPVNAFDTPATDAEPGYSEPAYDAQTFARQNDIRDASHAASQSTSDIQEQLQQWLSDDYSLTNRNQLQEVEPRNAAVNEGVEAQAEPAAPEEFFTGGVLYQSATSEQDVAAPKHTGDDDYAVSAFSAEALSIDDVSRENVSPYDFQPQDLGSELAPQDTPELEVELAPDEPAYQAADDTLDRHAAPKAADVAPSSETEGGDESVEDYMRRLLARMRGVSESEVKLPGLDRVENPKPEFKPRASQVSSDAASQSTSSDTEPVSEAWTEPFESEKYVPRISAPEKNRDINALRELANNSAWSAIHVSARRKLGTAIMIKSGVSLVGLAAGAALVSINGLNLNIGLVATLASFTVALIWGYDALATLRPLLQAARGAKLQAATPNAEEPKEVAS